MGLLENFHGDDEKFSMISIVTEEDIDIAEENVLVYPIFVNKKVKSIRFYFLLKLLTTIGQILN